MFEIRIEDSLHRGSRYERAHESEQVTQAPHPTATQVAGRASTSTLLLDNQTTHPDAQPGAQHHLGIHPETREPITQPPPLPDRYLGTPHGEQRRHATEAGIRLDANNQAYAQNGAHNYAARFDTANDTWRAIQLEHPEKPGIPIRIDSDGTWRTHADVGGPGGQPGHDAANKARLEQQHEQLTRAHQEGSAKKQDLLLRIADKEASKRRAEDEISSMTSRGLPDEIWGPVLSRPRAERTQIEQDLVRLRSQLDQLDRDQQTRAQQMAQVLSELLRHGSR